VAELSLDVEIDRGAVALEENEAAGRLEKKRGLFKTRYLRKKEAETVRGLTGTPVEKRDRENHRVMIDRKRTVSRPLRFYEVYPNRNRTVHVDQPMPRATHG